MSNQVPTSKRVLLKSWNNDIATIPQVSSLVLPCPCWAFAEKLLNSFVRKWVSVSRWFILHWFPFCCLVCKTCFLNLKYPPALDQFRPILWLYFNIYNWWNVTVKSTTVILSDSLSLSFSLSLPLSLKLVLLALNTKVDIALVNPANGNIMRHYQKWLPSSMAWATVNFF